jgi:hypothetical protein
MYSLKIKNLRNKSRNNKSRNKKSRNNKSRNKKSRNKKSRNKKSRNKKSSRRRVQIGCSKNMKGGGLNPFQALTDVKYSIEDAGNNLLNTFSGNNSIVSSNVTVQPFSNSN